MEIRNWPCNSLGPRRLFVLHVNKWQIFESVAIAYRFIFTFSSCAVMLTVGLPEHHNMTLDSIDALDSCSEGAWFESRPGFLLPGTC
jgi:hypothetical protein